MPVCPDTVKVGRHVAHVVDLGGVPEIFYFLFSTQRQDQSFTVLVFDFQKRVALVWPKNWQKMGPKFGQN